MRRRREGKNQWVLGGIFFCITLVMSFVTVYVMQKGAAKAPPVTTIVSTPDPLLNAAIEHARGEIDVLKNAVESPKGSKTAAKVRFLSPAGPEMMWVDHLAEKNDKWTGILADTPQILTGKHKGDPVDFGTQDIVDWLVMAPDHTQQGGFTDEVLRRENSAG